MDVDLTPELEQLVQSKVKSGRYNSASDVVGEALRLLEQRDEGWQSARRGEIVDGDEVFDRIDGELQVKERSPPK